ncbi:MAG: polysaccharide deacetylase family protein, partial [Candidatus Hodarchaeota archaeon]
MKIRFTQWPYGARCAFSTSWDDGYTTDMKVLKILEKHHVWGTFFITSKLVGEPGYLDRQQIRDIAKKGHEIGSHGHSHQNLCKIDEEQVLSALITSKVDMEELIGEEIFGFSYPFGYFNKRIKALVKLANYKYARTTKFEPMNYPPRDWFEWNPSLMAKGRGGYRKKLILKYIRFVNTRAFFTKDFPRDWAEIAHYMLISAYNRGSHFQLWGHS